ncbi:MAG: ParA family protein [Myxococcales bacterium]|nr:ParA family protein [Myxococcales bacterium]MCB9520593.1 ParA family protein [Myxococcales bacterium]MCB9531516.1 ParA family protein [Myxococcales bacterium]
MPAAAATSEVRCDACGTPFELRYAFQQVAVRSESYRVCSQACRASVLEPARSAERASARGPVRIAVLNQKGGTGKTTTAVNLAAGLADAGRRVLLIDTDAQGHVAVSLGVRGEKTLYHVLVEEAEPARVAVPLTEHLHVITSSSTLASAEIYLARMNEGRDRILRSRLASATQYDYVILDCGPSLSVLNMNALTYADELLVPVSCDFLSLVGVRQILKTVKHVNELLLHPVRVLGVLPTFYDQRNRISDESVKTLESHFGDRVLPPIRVNTRLKEAPSHGQTIFQYAPDSRGAADYRRVVRWVLERTENGARQRHGEEARA